MAVFRRTYELCVPHLESFPLCMQDTLSSLGPFFPWESDILHQLNMLEEAKTSALLKRKNEARDWLRFREPRFIPSKCYCLLIALRRESLVVLLCMLSMGFCFPQVLPPSPSLRSTQYRQTPFLLKEGRGGTHLETTRVSGLPKAIMYVQLSFLHSPQPNGHMFSVSRD